MEMWVWNPTPNRWCSEFACYIIKWHGIKSWEDNQNCEPIDVKDMWVKFRYTDEDKDNCPDRISPITEQIPSPNPDPDPSPDWYFYESPACAETWADLADLVKPGYYAGRFKEGKGEKSMHSFFFVEWIRDSNPLRDWTPKPNNGNVDVEPGECEARFYGIGGNQDVDKITGGEDVWFRIYNGTDPFCEETIEQAGDRARMIWGKPYNFFGIVN